MKFLNNIEDASKVVQDPSNRFVTDAEKTKLSGIEAGATANSTDAVLLNRANHMGTQAGTTITVADSGGYFVGADAETVLQEIGSTLNGLEAAITAIVG